MIQINKSFVTVLKLSLFALIPHIAFQNPSASAQEICQDNFHIQSPFPAGAAFISEAAMTYQYSNCPSIRSRLKSPIRLRVGQSLFFWFRVQGDESYLSLRQSALPFLMTVCQQGDTRCFADGTYNLKTLDRAAAFAESKGAGGPFDWRLGAERWRFAIPGSYRVSLQQQGQELPCANRSFLSSDCGFSIEVTE